LVGAALTILKAYHAAGMPDRPARLQGFEEWSDIVRGALMWIGLADPAETQDSLRENDPKLTKLIRIATVWRSAFGSDPKTVSEAVARAEEKKMTGTWENYRSEPAHPDLFEAFMAIARRGPAINPEAIGKYLSSEVDRVVALETGRRVRFEKNGKAHGAVLWVLAEADGEEIFP
jgi:putative DNA primase/helicase